MAGWSDVDRRRIAVLAETFVPGDGERRAELAIRAIDAGLDPAQAARLRLALRLLDAPLLNLVGAGRAASLAALSPAERERLLLGWARSPLGLRRSGFQAWKRLLLFLAYADPGPDGTAEQPTNPRWATIGYAPERAAAALAPTDIRPYPIPEPAPDGIVHLDADVVVVGSGAGGGVVAADLARAGRSVVVLEAGPFVPEPDMPSNELEGFDRLYLDHGLCSTSDGSVAILAGATVGGGTTVNWTTSIAVTPDVRGEWSREHGLDGIDGPQTETDLAELARELRLQPPAHLPPKDDAIVRGAAALGLEAAPTSRDADACGDCGSCGFGCRRGTKQSGLRAHLATAFRAGARIVPDARVTRVLVDGGRAIGVAAVVAPADGAAARDSSASAPRRLVVHARQVVVSAGALRTPVVLAASGIDHPAVGRYLRLHPVSAIAARYREPVRSWCGPLQAARSVAFLDSGARGRGFVVESAPAHPGLMALAFPWESAADHAATMATAAYSAPMIAIARDRGSGSVRPASEGRARIDYRVARRDADTLRRGLVEMARIARAAGAVEIVALGTAGARFELDAVLGTVVPNDAAFAAYLERLVRFDFGPNRGMVFSAHQMGSARMGGRAADHACDPDGRVRAARDGGVVRGLYVADASLFPTAIGVNPMLTVMLLARRVARTIVAEA